MSTPTHRPQASNNRLRIGPGKGTFWSATRDSVKSAVPTNYVALYLERLRKLDAEVLKAA